MGSVTLTEADDGGRIRLQVGDSITLILSESGGSGYRWTMPARDGALLAEDEHTITPGPAIGGAGTVRWRLRALRPGTTTVVLVKVRPWAPADAAARLHVDVTIVA